MILEVVHTHCSIVPASWDLLSVFYVSPKCSSKASRGAKANCTEFAEDPFKVWSDLVQRAATFESQKTMANWAVSKASTQRMHWIA